MASEDVSTDDLTVQEPKPVQPKPASNLDLINECDNFPYRYHDATAYDEQVSCYYKLMLPQCPDVNFGYLLPSVAEIFRGLPDWTVDDRAGTLTLLSGSNEFERSATIAKNAEAMRQLDHFTILRGWRDELYPVYGPDKQLLFSIERSASALFGVVTYGCHMTAYTLDGDDDDDAAVDKTSMKIWVPRRSYSKSTYAGMLDNTVAGGLATGETPLTCVAREAAEEASLPEAFVRDHAKAVGSVTYFHIRDARAGGETGLLQPECQYVYDLELPADGSLVPKPCDGEVHAFELMRVEEVRQAMSRREFKPNCALVMLDFFVRHGLLTPSDEDYLEIVARLHRRLEFPTV